MPPTQKELAKFAGVSSGTVSNVINGATGVSERARKKVQAAIEALNYRPNLIARSLRTNRTHTLGMVIPDVTIPFFPKLIRGAEWAARKAGYFLIVLDSENNNAREESMLSLLRAQRVEGILLVAAGEIEDTGTAYRALAKEGPPLVCLDRLPRGLEVDSICVDDSQAAEMAVSHLLEKGHSQIAVITGPMHLQNEQERLRGYRRALQKSGIPVRDTLIWKGSFDEEEVANLCQQGLLRPTNRPTALFATNGVTGLAALRAIYGMGLTTPDDIAFVTFDELNSEPLFRPGITSIVQPAYEIGSRAVETLLKRIEQGNRNELESSLERVRLPARLYVRESTSGSAASYAEGKDRRPRRNIAT
jgi:DNA-binding LacI/PurR family transcriptional regulator